MNKKNIIAIETSTDFISVAILYKKNIFIKYKYTPKRNSKYTIVIINNIIKNYNIPLKKINYIIINKGPGSIIGLRITNIIASLFKLKFNNIKILKISSFKIIFYKFIKIKKIYNFYIVIYIKNNIIYFFKIKNKKIIKKKKINISLFLLKIKKKDFIVVNNYQLKIKIINILKKYNKNIFTCYPTAKYMLDYI